MSVCPGRHVDDWVDAVYDGDEPDDPRDAREPGDEILDAFLVPAGDEYLDRLADRIKRGDAADVYRRRLAELEGRGVHGGQLHADLTRALMRVSRAQGEHGHERVTTGEPDGSLSDDVTDEDTPRVRRPAPCGSHTRQRVAKTSSRARRTSQNTTRDPNRPGEVDAITGGTK